MGTQLDRRISREDWLRAALSMVVETGVAGLGVKELAASLGATTGSLYWHFRNRADLMDALLEFWATESTEPVAAELATFKGSPQARLFQLMKLIAENEPTSGDIPIRGWAAHDSEVAKVVARVDRRRADVIGGLFYEMGFRDEELLMRTRLLLCYESCERLVFSRISKAARAALLERRHALLCRPT